MKHADLEQDVEKENILFQERCHATIIELCLH